MKNRLTSFERHFVVDEGANVTLDDLMLILYNIRELAFAFERVYFDEMKEGQQENVFGALAELVGQAIVLAEHFQMQEQANKKEGTER
ncbi:MAG: hypothetical protein ACREVK_08060 [Gammaproteobacteria bacterium]